MSGAGREERLRERVRTRVFPGLARGLVMDHRRRTGRANQYADELDAVFAGTLRLVSRLVFLLHADARGRLPAPGLDPLRAMVADRADSDAKRLAVSRETWGALTAASALVRGPLFDAADEAGAFLEAHGISDFFLVPALDALLRDDDGATVEHGALDAVAAGALCEGLLGALLVLDDEGNPRLENDRAEPSDPKLDGVAAYLVRETLAPLAEAADPLALRVVDPAMGTGRFLVHAFRWLAAHLPEDTPREAILHRLFGVDVNPRAVELARLSLWMEMYAAGAPLPPLDGRLRAGNALVGTRVRAVAAAMKANPRGQLSGFGGPFDDVFPAAARARDGDDGGLSPFRRLLDVWVSRGFGNRRAEEVATLHAGEVMAAAEGRRARLNREQSAALSHADALAGEHAFLHWDLAFPEAFLDHAGTGWAEDGGFDAVIGRPPAGTERARALKAYLASAFGEVHDGAAEPYVYFVRQGWELLRAGGRMGVLVPDRWLRAPAGEKLRGWLADRARLERIVDLAGAEPPAAVLVVSRPAEGEESDQGDAAVALVPRGGESDLAAAVAAGAYAVPRARFGATPWSLERPEVDGLMRRIREGTVLLKEYAGARPVPGIRTGMNDAFVVDAPTRDRLVHEDGASAEVLAPFLRAADVERWSPAWAGLWIVCARRGVHIDRYPAVKRHLSAFREQLEPRPDGFAGERWDGRRAGAYAWYELQDDGDDAAFAAPKIVWRDLTPSSQWALDRDGFVPGDGCWALPSGDPWLLTVLNSPVLWSYLWRSVGHGRDEALRLKSVNLEYLPVAPAPRGAEGEVESAVGKLLEITGGLRGIRREMAEWLRAHFAVERPGPRLERFDDLNADEFVAEVRARRPKRAEAMKALDLKALRNAHADSVPRMVSLAAQASGLEGRLARLVNRAYGLSEAEVDLLWRTAPPRMPPGR